jgi:flagellar hook assembly protein FlgD
MGYLENEVLVYFVEDIEIDNVMSKIKKFLGDDIKHEYNQEKMGLKVIFRDREKAEWCIKLFGGNFVVNGKKLTFKWIKDKPRPKRNIKGEILNEEGEKVEKKETKKKTNKRDYDEAMMPDGEVLKKA